jgi:hypothetical protein
MSDAPRQHWIASPYRDVPDKSNQEMRAEGIPVQKSAWRRSSIDLPEARFRTVCRFFESGQRIPIQWVGFGWAAAMNRAAAQGRFAPAAAGPKKSDLVFLDYIDNRSEAICSTGLLDCYAQIW